jgi:hypothetical protein
MEAARLSVPGQGVSKIAAIHSDVCRPERATAGYSRNTARGASSPAKPALHIPELAKVSSNSLYQRRACPAVDMVSRLVVVVGAANVDNPTAAGMVGLKIGVALPIVDDESCDFLYERRKIC